MGKNIINIHDNVWAHFHSLLHVFLLEQSSQRSLMQAEYLLNHQTRSSRSHCQSLCVISLSHNNNKKKPCYRLSNSTTQFRHLSIVVHSSAPSKPPSLTPCYISDVIEPAAPRIITTASNTAWVAIQLAEWNRQRCWPPAKAFSETQHYEAEQWHLAMLLQEKKKKENKNGEPR